MTEPTEEFSFEEALKKIESIVSKIEEGDINIDDLTREVGTAAALLQQCRKYLRKTEDDLEQSLEELDQ
ncbi:MAG: exodeoxyribonuclease VII small subunit [Cyclobacteriaceae bacterium]